MQPSRQPTGQPSRQPLSRPTSQPTSQPSSKPSRQPSAQPSSRPSMQPSQQPSMQPSSQPSRQPSAQPSSQPSIQPSAQPSMQPSMQPSRQPTGQPSRQPLSRPTSQPSLQPSMQPSMQPSRQPTGQPSAQPSHQPTSRPSRQPTSQPTTQPTHAPSTVLQQRVVVSASQYFAGLTSPAQFTSDVNASKLLISTIAQALNVDPFYVNITSVSLVADASTITGRRERSRALATSAVQVTTTISMAIPFQSTQASVLSSVTSTMSSSSFASTLASNMQSSALVSSGTASLLTYASGSASVVSPSVYIVVTKSAPPSGYPTGRPSTRPTMQPSAQPTTFPTSYCTPGTIVNGLHCTTCLGGTMSATYSATSCDTCPPGTFAVAGSSSCTPCLQGFYSPNFGVSACAACAPSRTTPTIGATSVDSCVNPVNNFALGGVTTFVVALLGFYYVVNGRYERVAFLRKQRVTQPLKDSYSASTNLLYERIVIANLEKAKDKANVEKQKKRKGETRHVWIFLVASFFLCSFMTIAIFVTIISSVFFKSLILYHGFNFSPNIAYITQMEDAISELANAIHAPDFIRILFTPFTYIFYALSNLHIDLSSVNVTCLGATSSFELFFDVMILGAIIVVIKSEYQLFRGVSFPGVTNGYLTYAFLPSYAKLVKKKPMGWTWFTRGRFLLWTLAAELVGHTDIFQTSLQYLTSFVNIKSFVARNGIQHQFTAACDTTTPLPPVFPGIFGIDSLLALLSTILAYMLVLPTIYEIAKILCPSLQKSFFGKKELFGIKFYDENDFQTSDDAPQVVAVSAAEAVSSLEAANQQEQAKQHSLLRYVFKLQSLLSPDLMLATFASQWIKTIYKALPDKKFTKFAKKGGDWDHKKIKWTKRIRSHFSYCCGEGDEEDEEDDEEEDDEEEVEGDVKQEEEKQEEVQALAFPEAVPIDDKEFSGMLFVAFKKQAPEEVSSWRKDSKEQLPSYLKLCRLEYLALTRLVQDLPCVIRLIPNYLIFPLLVFFGLGHVLTLVGFRTWAMVLYKFILFGQISIGYWTDETVEAYNILPCKDEATSEYKGGKCEYSLYASKYEKADQREEEAELKLKEKHAKLDVLDLGGHGGSIDIGIGEDSVQKQEDDTSSSQASRKRHVDLSQNGVYRAQQDYSLILSCIISARCVLYQIVPEFTILTVFSSTASSSPFIVRSSRLAQRLPKLWIDDAFNVAREQEEELEHFTHEERKVKSEEEKKLLDELDDCEHHKAEKWLVNIRGVYIFVTESRLVQNVLNLYRFCLTIGLLYSVPKAWMLSTLIIILPYSFVRSLYFVMLLGKFMDVTDNDLHQAFSFSYMVSSSASTTTPRHEGEEEEEASSSRRDQDDLSTSARSSSSKANITRQVLRGLGGQAPQDLASELATVPTTGADSSLASNITSFFGSALTVTTRLATLGLVELKEAADGDGDDEQRSVAASVDHFEAFVNMEEDHAQANFVGKRMTIHGFEMRPELNGMTVKVLSCKEGGVFRVLIKGMGVYNIEGSNLLLEEEEEKEGEEEEKEGEGKKKSANTSARSE